MNNAKINGKNIEDRDYVIIDADARNPETGDYILSVIDGTCNIKKFKEDRPNNRIVLLSELLQDFPPIYIHSKEIT